MLASAVICLAFAVPKEFRAWQLAFVRDKNLYVSRGDGSGPKMVAQSADTPCWSPDRRKLAFSRGNGLWIVDAQGKGLRRVLELKGAAEIDSLSWGNRILTGKRGPLVQGQALVFSAQGKLYQYAIPDKGAPYLEGLSCLYGNAVYGRPAFRYPVWSPKKPYLAYSAEGDIWIAEQEGGTAGEGAGLLCGRLAATADYDIPNNRGSRTNVYAEGLSWSPDGKTIAFCRQRQFGSGVWQLCIVQAPSGEYWIDERPAWSVVLEDAASPSFSPDGKWLAVWRPSDDQGWSGVGAVSLDGKQWVRLVRDAEQPCW